MAPVDLTNPRTFPGALAYHHTDIPLGMTLHDRRRQRAHEARSAQEARRAARHARVRRLLTGAALRRWLNARVPRRPAGVAP